MHKERNVPLTFSKLESLSKSKNETPFQIELNLKTNNPLNIEKNKRSELLDLKVTKHIEEFKGIKKSFRSRAGVDISGVGVYGVAPIKIYKTNINTSEPTASPGLQPSNQSPDTSMAAIAKSKINSLEGARKMTKHFSVNSNNFATMITLQDDSTILNIDLAARHASLSPVRNPKSNAEVGLKSGVVRSGYRSNSLYHSFIQKKKEYTNADFEMQLRLFKDRIAISWKIDNSRDWDIIEQNIQLGFKMGVGGFGVVYEGLDKVLKTQVAIKVIDKLSVHKHEDRYKL